MASAFAKRAASWKVALAVALAAMIALAGSLAAWEAVYAHTFIRLTCADTDDNTVTLTEGDTYTAKATGHADRDGTYLDYMAVFWQTEDERDSNYLRASRKTDYQPIDWEWDGAYQYGGGLPPYSVHHDIETKDDSYPELTEYFTLGINNDENESGRTRCRIKILDDDTPGVYKAEITTEPDDGETYNAGERIDVDLYFNNPIKWTANPSNPQPTDTAITLMVGDTPRRAVMGTYGTPLFAAPSRQSVGSSFTWVIPAETAITVSYTVQTDDVDADGISVVAGDDDGNGWWESTEGYAVIPTIHDPRVEEIDTNGDDIIDTFEVKRVNPFHGHKVNNFYRGIENAEDQKVDGTSVPDVVRFEIHVPPDNGEYFVAGEKIYIKLHFDEAVTIGEEFVSDPNEIADVTVGLQIGDTVRTATFYAGSGSTALSFEYTVQPGDIDADGITVAANSLTDTDSIFQLSGRFRGPNVNPDFEELTESSGYTVDAVAGVESVSIISTPADGETYKLGENIELALDFDMEVDVGSDRQKFLELRVGDEDAGDEWRPAHYKRGSGTKRLVFGYTVRQEDEDTDGIRVTGINGSKTINTFGSDVAADLHFEELGNQSGHKVDGSLSLQRYEIISSPANGDTYRYGETIELSFTFNTALDVEGTPAVSLRLGEGSDGSVQRATYVRGSGTNTLVFGYQVRATDRDPDGLSLRGTWVHSDGRIGGIYRDGGARIHANGIDVSFEFATLANRSGHEVDGRRAYGEASIISSPADGDTYRRGETIELAFTFPSPLDVEGTPAVSIKLAEEGSEGAVRRATYVRGSGTNTLVFSYDVKTADRDPDGLSLRGTWLHSDGRVGGVYFDDGDRILGGDTDVAIVFDTLANQSGHNADGRPYVKSMAVTSTPAEGDTYFTGEVIQATVTFDQNVDVEGLVNIQLAFSTADLEFFVARQASYVSGSGTADLVFEYAVQEGDEDDDGVGFHGSTVSGTVRAAGTDVAFDSSTTPDPDWDVTGHKVDGTIVDTTPPTFVSAETDQSGELVTLTFSETIGFPPLLIQVSDLVGVDPYLFLRAVLDVRIDGELVTTIVWPAGSFSADDTWATMDLTVDPLIAPEHSVTVSYDNVFARDAARLFIDGAGNALEFFSDEAVTNNSIQTWFVYEEWSGPQLVLNPSTDATVTEGESLQYDLSLSAKPEFAVTVHVIPFPDSALALSPSAITIEPDNWDQPHTVNLTAKHDPDTLNFWERVAFRLIGEDVDPRGEVIRIVIEDDDAE